MSPPSSFRLTWTQLIVVGTASVAVTALVVSTGLGRTSAQTAALAALHRRPVVLAGGGSPSTAAGGSSPASASATTNAPAPAAYGTNPAPRTTPASASLAGGSPAGGGGGSYIPPASTTTTTPGQGTKQSPPAKHKVKHVFVIALSTTSFDDAFGGHSAMPYLSRTLKRQGTLLGGYQTLGETELPDYLAMVSGQPPNADTRGDCASYVDFPTAATPAANGRMPGVGCVYPNTVLTLGDQVNAAGGTWKAYIDQMNMACVHPNSEALDNVPLTGAGPGYDTRHNPFIYFHSLLDLGGCAENDVSLEQLPKDLHSATKTARLTFIAPQACLDSSARNCPNSAPSGLAGEDAFLKKWVPAIIHSPSYKHDGVLILTFALSPAGTQPGTTPKPDTPVPTGTLVLSRFAARGKTISTIYDPYSVLRTIEDLLGYQPLALARTAKSFAASTLPGA